MESLIHISEQSPLPGVELSVRVFICSLDLRSWPVRLLSAHIGLLRLQMMGDLYFQQLNPLSVLSMFPSLQVVVSEHVVMNS